MCRKTFLVLLVEGLSHLLWTSVPWKGWYLQPFGDHPMMGSLLNRKAGVVLRM